MNEQQRPRVLALVGMPGSGKSLCAEYLNEQGYFKYRLGQIVVDEVAARGMDLTPSAEREVREELREKEGINAIARRALPPLQEAIEDHQTVVIDGLYGFGEYKLLNEAFGGEMVVVAIVANRPLRYERLANRPERPLTPDEAQERDYREIETLEKGGPIAIADYTLLNDGTADDLLDGLQQLLDRLDIQP